MGHAPGAWDAGTRRSVCSSSLGEAGVVLWWCSDFSVEEVNASAQTLMVHDL